MLHDLHNPAREDSAMDWFEVMRRFESGDRAAFVQLCGLIRDKLARMRRHNQLLHAEDVVQDCLICLLKAWRRGCIREERCFEGFVWRLAERRLADAWNRQVRPGTPDCVGEPELVADMDEALAAESRRESALDLTRALERLGDADRRVLRAIYLEGQTYSEAAARLNLPLGTFKRRLGDGLRRLRADFN
jgi:RNA polymerase sigma-70 factor (ECF subfamily)